MNEYIKKLAQRSGFYFYDLHDIDGEDLGESIEADDWYAAEKFAQQVAIDCANICERCIQPSECAREIRRMFGVKQ